ncbi:MAG: sugar ABC transporter permease [Elusimicrobia bacterium CG08_land_8_20_14_0_20_51_18]|nr:MAG: sugar ABC transporter permease [Elusimicrobia bacterium CG08_land_8_20_14_0_20_51_18]
MKKQLSKTAFYAFMLISVAITLFPFIWMISTSFKPPDEIFTKHPSLFPSRFTLDGYRQLFAAVSMWTHLFNSVIYAVFVTILSVLFNSMAAYAFAKLRFPGREKLFALLLVTMMVPGQVTMLPVFLILKSMGLLNTYAGLIIPGSAAVFAIFMIRQFMAEIPEEILEAARIDGLSEFSIFWRIILPLCRPIIATLAVFSFIGAWNDFLWPLIIMLREDKYTLPVALASANGQYNTDWAFLMAGAVVVVIPAVLIFLLAQKHYIKGIAAGAVKG